MALFPDTIKEKSLLNFRLDRQLLEISVLRVVKEKIFEEII